MTSEAHFLHEKSGLEAVLSPPLERPRAMDWVGTSTRLIVATADGELIEVDPIFGTRTLADRVDDPALLAVAPHGKRMAILERCGRVALHAVGNGKRIAELPFQLVGDMSMAWFRTRGALALVVCGDTLKGRQALIVDEEFKRTKRARLPSGAVLGPGKEGRLLIARCSPTGLDVMPFGKAMEPMEPTSHRLRFGPQGQVIGMTNSGVTCWRGPRDSPHTVAMLDVTAAAVSPDGRQVAIGGRGGEVALAQVDGDQVARGRPGKVGGHTSAVRRIVFSFGRDNWLASSGERLQIWKY